MFAGDYAGFDETCPTCESGGKPRVMTLLKERHGYKCVIHIGDGVTDMEACPPAVCLTLTVSYSFSFYHPCLRRYKVLISKTYGLLKLS